VFKARAAVGVKVAILPVPSRVTTPVTPGDTVKVVVEMVTGFMASLKVAVTTVLGHTPMAPLGGVTEITAGGGGAAHDETAVIKVHTKLLASALPEGSLAPVVIVTVYVVLSARLLEGVKVNILLVASPVTVPVTPGATVKVVVLMVVGSIACGKVAAMTVLGHTPAEASGGVTETGGAGGKQAAALVVKVQTKLLARLLPYKSCALVVIVAV
jgi:hypothetical protein